MTNIETPPLAYRLTFNGAKGNSEMEFLFNQYNRAVCEGLRRHRAWYDKHEKAGTFFLPSTMDAIRYAVSEASEINQVKVAENNPHHPRNQEDWGSRLDEEICDFTAMIFAVALTDSEFYGRAESGETVIAGTQFSEAVGGLINNPDNSINWFDVPLALAGQLLLTQHENDMKACLLYCAALCDQRQLSVIQAIQAFHAKIDERVNGQTGSDTE